MKRITTTQGQVAFVDDEDYNWLIQYNWCNDNGYARRNISNGIYRGHIYMHKEIYSKYQPNWHGEVDHIDQYKGNNQKYNLRPATDAQTSANRPIHSNNLSGYKGVSPSKNKFIARIRFKGEQSYLGTFSTAIEAAKAYDRAAIRTFGEYASLNFPRSNY